MPSLTPVKVSLIGKSGNAFSILGTVRLALRQAGYDKEADAFYLEATSGDYDNLLRTAMKYVEVE